METSMQFDHVALQVPDIGEAIDWYLRMIPGSEALHRDPSWGLVSAGGAKVAFVLAGQHPNHIAWRVDEDALEEIATREGAPISPHRDGTRSIYLDSPGGHHIEVISYPTQS